jgi:NTP pyrophosphatase (non-canonical NTP hydrolase)
MDEQLVRLTSQAVKFRDARKWEQFHNGKDLAINLSVEASELLELFLWKSDEAVNQEKLQDELADVFYSLLLLSDKFSVDLDRALTAKLRKNEEKYPVAQYLGSNKKYTE